MTLDKHEIKGLPSFERKIVAASTFETLMQNAGYFQIGTGKGQKGRVKVWWSHASYPHVESIYSPNRQTVITAYHPDP